MKKTLTTLFTASVTTLPLIWSGCQDKTSSKETCAPVKPNIIFIMADDLGYHDLGCYSQTQIKTPNIDRLAQEGMRFTNCYAGSPVSAPSRSVLMTGQHTGHTTVRGNTSPLVDRPYPYNRVPLNDEDTTVAEVLKKAGYVTGITGKWGLGEPDTEGIPNKQGFDEWFGYLNQNHAHSYYPPYLWKNQEKFILEKNQDGQKGTYTHDLFTDFALDFIKKHKDTTFFLYLPYTIPHAEYAIPDTAPYKNENWDEKAKVHAAMITRMDKDIGKMMNLLKETKIDSNTIVFFCSDNGAARRWEGTFNSSGALRGRKRDVYEGGIRTPMIVRMPDIVPAGAVSDEPWYFADVLPTMADIAGVEPPENIDGISVLPVITGKKQQLAVRYLYWEFHEGGYYRAARWKNWKAIKLKPDTAIELYDLAVDPGEKYNVAGLHPELIQQFENYLDTARTVSKHWTGKTKPTE